MVLKVGVNWQHSLSPTLYITVILTLNDTLILCRAAPVKTVIIDCAPIGFMDVVGVKTLQQVI